MKITSESPKDWKELQNFVCRYLNESGYKAESPKTIKVVRGEVEVDVYATAKNELIKMFLCECKNWNTPVPKEKVHAFRSVVADSGATVGILISKSGFQKGAIEAAYCSNVLLRDWDGFIELIKNQWIHHRLLYLKHLVQPLSVYIDPLDVDIDSYDEELKEKYLITLKKCFNEYMVGNNLNYGMLTKESISVGDRSFYYMNDFFKYMEKIFEEAISEFSILLPNVDEYKFDSGGYTLFSMLEDYYYERYL